MKRWKDNWDAISPMFKFSSVVRKVIYTTNAIESLNSTYRKLTDREVYSQAIQHFLRLYIWPHLKKLKNGLKQYETVHRFTGSLLSCTKVGFLNRIRLKNTWVARPPCIDFPFFVIYKNKGENPI